MEVLSLAGELLQSAAEHVASYRVGQSALRYLDRTLWVVEKCARWAVPPPLDQDERPQPELVRPLPWVFFLPLLIILRVTRESISLANLIMGKPPLRSADVVIFIQGKRRYLRTLKYQGNRMMRARTSSGTVQEPWFQRLQSLFEFTMCFRNSRHYGNNNTTSVSNNDEVLVVKHSKRVGEDPSPVVAGGAECTMERLIEKMMVDLDADSDEENSFTLTNVTSVKSDRSECMTESDQDATYHDAHSTEPTTTETKHNTNPTTPETKHNTDPTTPETKHKTDPITPETKHNTDPTVPETKHNTDPTTPEAGSPNTKPATSEVAQHNTQSTTPTKHNSDSSPHSTQPKTPQAKHNTDSSSHNAKPTTSEVAKPKDSSHNTQPKVPVATKYNRDSSPHSKEPTKSETPTHNTKPTTPETSPHHTQPTASKTTTYNTTPTSPNTKPMIPESPTQNTQSTTTPNPMPASPETGTHNTQATTLKTTTHNTPPITSNTKPTILESPTHNTQPPPENSTHNTQPTTSNTHTFTIKNGGATKVQCEDLLYGTPPQDISPKQESLNFIQNEISHVQTTPKKEKMANGRTVKSVPSKNKASKNQRREKEVSVARIAPGNNSF